MPISHLSILFPKVSPFPESSFHIFFLKPLLHINRVHVLYLPPQLQPNRPPLKTSPETQTFVLPPTSHHRSSPIPNLIPHHCLPPLFSGNFLSASPRPVKSSLSPTKKERIGFPPNPLTPVPLPPPPDPSV